MMGDVTNDEAAGRYELTVEGETAFADYREAGGTVTFTHTLVPDAVEGQGVGTRLIEGALDDVAERGLRVMPQCPFVAHVIETTPKYRSLVD